jgi:protein-S-isoprenylcysteine O-methyltransferase Ste14
VPALIRSALKACIGIAIFAGLPLLGWGIKDIQGFVGHPARLGYVVLVALLQVLVVILFPAVGRDRGAGTKIVRRQRLAVLMLQVLSLAILLVAPYCDRRGIAVISEVQLVRYLGLVLFASGFLVMNWAEALLGRQFSVQVTIQEGHKLVTGGLYRYLRHPRYLGIITFNTGIALGYLSWLALILVAALTLVLLWRIHDEEAFMHQKLGADWEAYSKRSWRLIPFVY